MEHSYWHIRTQVRAILRFFSVGESAADKSSGVGNNAAKEGHLQEMVETFTVHRHHSMNWLGYIVNDRCKYLYHHLHQYSIVAQLLTTYHLYILSSGFLC